jgi:hypothetical protein
MLKKLGRCVLATMRKPHRPGNAPALGPRAGAMTFSSYRGPRAQRRRSMRCHHWFRNGLTQPRKGCMPRPSGRRRLRPRLEQFENRTLLSSYTALTVSDLINDINAANKKGGSNTITLGAPTTSAYVLTAVDNTTDGPTGLPAITSKDHLTIVGDGDIIERSTAAGTPAFRLFDVSKDASLTLQNLTVQNGLEDGSGSSAEGGAIYNEGALILCGVAVQGNTAQGSTGVARFKGPGNPGADAAGGGVWSNGTVTLENSSTIQSNLAVGGVGGQVKRGTAGTGGSGSGGGLFVAGGTVSITSTTFSGNEAKGGAGGSAYIGTAGNGGAAFGGGLYVATGTVTLTGSTLENNTAQGGIGDQSGPSSNPGTGGNGSGGGLYVAGGIVTLSSDMLQYNTAQGGFSYSGGGGYGGGLDVAGGTVTLCTDTVESNLATGVQGFGVSSSDFGGGIYIELGGTVYIDPSTVANTINNTDPSGTNGSTANIDGSYIPRNC